jgi:signal transduction histidine kinase
MTEILLTKNNPNESAALPSGLMQALEKFNEHSLKLEAQHAELLQEVDDLRMQLRQKDEEVKRAERLAMLGETAAGLAHEIRNPLGAISLFVSMLKADLKDRPDSVDLVEQIERGIKSLDSVVSNVLHFAKNKQLSCAPMNVHSVIQELYQHFSSLYSPQTSFEISLGGNPFIIGDDQGIRQSLYNIITNSLQAISFAGAVRIEVGDSTDSDVIVITLSDDGPGIPEELLGRLFTPFASGRRDGTGLGLSIVRRIVESHGGSVSARNTPHAEFTIVLPRKGPRVSVGV